MSAVDKHFVDNKKWPTTPEMDDISKSIIVGYKNTPEHRKSLSRPTGIDKDGRPLIWDGNEWKTETEYPSMP